MLNAIKFYGSMAHEAYQEVPLITYHLKVCFISFLDVFWVIFGYYILT
jgi:hypothetical protein